MPDNIEVIGLLGGALALIIKGFYSKLLIIPVESPNYS